MNEFKLPEIKLSDKQKLILEVLKDEFHGSGFGPQILKETDNKDLQQLTINQVTWHMLRLRDAGLVKSKKSIYEGRELNEYSITEYIKYEVIRIK